MQKSSSVSPTGKAPRKPLLVPQTHKTRFQITKSIQLLSRNRQCYDERTPFAVVSIRRSPKVRTVNLLNISGSSLTSPNSANSTQLYPESRKLTSQHKNWKIWLHRVAPRLSPENNPIFSSYRSSAVTYTRKKPEKTSPISPHSGRDSAHSQSESRCKSSASSRYASSPNFGIRLHPLQPSPELNNSKLHFVYAEMHTTELAAPRVHTPPKRTYKVAASQPRLF